MLDLSWTDIWESLRIADALDVVFVSIFFYSAIAWFRKARSRFMLVGLGILAGLYGMARLLEMRVTLLLFQAGITVALIALVVIFQEEIRRFFERMATPRLLRARAVETATTELTRVLLEAVPHLAEHRVGALIVIKGREPLERHLTGGIDLEGRPSPALLYSIFDTSSSGHDGAVIVEAGTIRKFATHLPLSTNVKGDAPFGTRHTAALGLSECCDALVVVVSEERGEVSVARDGKLTVLGSPLEIRGQLRIFFREIEPEISGLARFRLTRNLGVKTLAFCLACAAWLAISSTEGRSVSRAFQVPIALSDVPEGQLIEGPHPTEVRLTLSGLAHDFRGIDTDDLVALIPASELRAGSQSIPIEERNIQIPQGFRLIDIEPRTIIIVVPDTVTKEVDIRPVTKGRVAPPLKLVEVVTTPTKVPLLVPRDDSGDVRQVRTEPVDLAEIEGTVTVTRALVLPQGVRLPRDVPPTVEVTIRAVPRRSPGEAE
jgi:uncharacterized protein (TIGR00159 family)